MCVKDLVLCVSFLSVSAVVTSCSTALVAVPGRPVVIAHRGGAWLVGMYDGDTYNTCNLYDLLYVRAVYEF